MIITWDEPKREANIAEHGMDFADLDEAFFAEAIIIDSYSERFLAIGRKADGMISAVFARLGREGISVISMRRASKKERKLYGERKETGLHRT